jgi:putative phosphoribosyl transferase
MERKFKNRTDAGRVLAQKLQPYANQGEIIVLALPRGGVPVAYEVARALGAPLDVFLVRKLGLPGHEELAMGAIATGGVRILNDSVVRAFGIQPETINTVATREQHRLEQRQRSYRGDRPPPQISGRMVIVVDDGLATGSSMRAAIMAIKRQNPARLVVAVPVGAPETCREIEAEADEVVCAQTPDPFLAVGLWYQDFGQTTDEEVREVLDRAAHADFVASTRSHET